LNLIVSSHAVWGKNVYVDVEVENAPLDYNMLFGRSWFYEMIIVAFSVFLMIQFSHQGKIVTIDQLDYFTPNVHNNTSNSVPFMVLTLGTEFGLQQINPEATLNHFGLEAALPQPERDLSNNVTI
jgi:hypothetical protein